MLTPDPIVLRVPLLGINSGDPTAETGYVYVIEYRPCGYTALGDDGTLDVMPGLPIELFENELALAVEVTPDDTTVPDAVWTTLAKLALTDPAVGKVTIYKPASTRYMITHCIGRTCSLLKLRGVGAAPLGYTVDGYLVSGDYCEIVEPTDDDLVAMAKITLLKGVDQ